MTTRFTLRQLLLVVFLCCLSAAILASMNDSWTQLQVSQFKPEAAVNAHVYWWGLKGVMTGALLCWTIAIVIRLVTGSRYRLSNRHQP